MATFHVSLITPEAVTFQGDVDHVRVPAHEGYLGLLAGHAATLTSLTQGAVTIQTGPDKSFYAIGSGILEVSGSEVLIMADNVEAAESDDDAKEKASALAKSLEADPS